MTASSSVGCAWQVRATSSHDAPYSMASTPCRPPTLQPRHRAQKHSAHTHKTNANHTDNTTYHSQTSTNGLPHAHPSVSAHRLISKPHGHIRTQTHAHIDAHAKAQCKLRFTVDAARRSSANDGLLDASKCPVLRRARCTAPRGPTSGVAVPVRGARATP